MAEVTETEQIIATEVTDILKVEQELVNLEQQLSENEEFRAFLTKQKKAREDIAAFWKRVEKEMIDHDIKSIKGEWGSITVAERLDWDISPLLTLPNKFYKRVPDKTRLSATYRLEGKPIKGATPKFTKYLTKKIK